MDAALLLIGTECAWYGMTLYEFNDTSLVQMM